MGNPFLDDFAELIALDNRNCMDDLVVNALCTIENIGQISIRKAFWKNAAFQYMIQLRRTL